ncbi:ATP-binding protein [Sinosporangium siamense]|uniref:ATP-binding protein n=1 Tax=Sinosporangium siamense TaxID=1367973 RepID=UPI0035A24A9F
MARAWIWGHLAEKHMSADQAHVVVLLTSELVTNALTHSKSRHGEVTVLLQVSQYCVRVDVMDDGSAGGPVLGPTRVDAENGRGLVLVDQLAHRWGDYFEASGRAVWFEVERQLPAGNGAIFEHAS